jgi:hypothetical protein
VSLAPGTRPGLNEILAAIDASGLGDVHRRLPRFYRPGRARGHAWGAFIRKASAASASEGA